MYDDHGSPEMEGERLWKVKEKRSEEAPGEKG
jgi:hypothetical protein